MDLTKENTVSVEILHFLRCCYIFVNEEWPHATRQSIPDQGFEDALRSACLTKLKGWRISQAREMHLGEDLDTASGTCHEIDLVALHDEALALVEAKHWESGTPTKNEVIVFFAKILDYVTANPRLTLREVCPVFVSVSGFEESGLAACLGLGVHPIAPCLRPLPILVDSGQRMEVELSSMPRISEESAAKLNDYWASLRCLHTALEPTWFSSRVGYLSEQTVALKATTCVDAVGLSRTLRCANADCLALINAFKKNRAGSIK